MMEKILLRPKELRKELYIVIEQRERLEAACQRLTVRYGTARVRNGSVDHDGALAALADCDAQYGAQIARKREALAAAEREAEDLLNRFALASPVRIGYRDAEVLRLWYLRDLEFQEIQSEMERKGFPCVSKTLKKWYADALRRFERFGETAQ